MLENRWRDGEAAKYVAAAGSDEADKLLALRVYTSRLIGGDKELVMHGGGNTSCKVKRRDIFGNEIDVLHVKGSGWDLATIKAAGLPGVRLQPLIALRQLDVLSDEDMVNMQRCNLLDANSPNPSVETLLHAYLPHKVVDHTHATAMLALANLPDAAGVAREIFGDKIAVVPFIMPGFALAKAAADIYDANGQVEGLLLLQHGYFAFGADAKTSYDLIIEHTNKVEAWFADKQKGQRNPASSSAQKPAMTSQEILPLLRGIIGAANVKFSNNKDASMAVMDLRVGPQIDAFFARSDIAALARRGVATPDHVIRIKHYPLHLSHEVIAAGRAKIATAVDEYVTGYSAYFADNAVRFANTNDAKTQLSPVPNLAWIEGVGLVGMGANGKAASTAADLGEQNIDVMSAGENCGGFFPVGEKNIFDMEYWSLEQAKLGKGPVPDLQGQIVMITGGAGAIGLATAKAFAAKGANIFLVDRDEKGLAKALDDLGPWHDSFALDITKEGSAETAMATCVDKFGGLDILISNAGAAWPGEMQDLADEDLRKSLELNFFAHRNFAKAAGAVFCTQQSGGQILFNVSKQAVNPGRGFGAYGIPKAATFFLLRQLALELGPHGVRVNGINADRIRSGLLDDAFVSQRAKARGVDEETYMAGNLLRREVEAHHVADGFVALAMSERTSAHVLTIDGGNIEAALR